jgi:hypothetical protein
MNTKTRDIARRIKRLEELSFEQRAEDGPDLVGIVLERRRKRAIAEGREPEPDPPRARLVYTGGEVSIADVLLHDRMELRERANSAPGGEGSGKDTNRGPTSTRMKDCS